MPEITIFLSPAHAQRVSRAIQGLWPIPQIPDPKFVGNSEDVPLIDEFTPMEWAEESIKRFLRRTTRRWENKVATRAATVAEDPTIGA